MDNNKPLFLKLSREDQKAALEALIFASEEPVTYDTLFKILVVGKNVKIPVSVHNEEQEQKQNGSSEPLTESSFDYEKEAKSKWDFSVGLFEELITEINIELINTNRPFQIIQVGGGWQFGTRKEFGELIHHLTRSRPKRRFSQAALECLAIIAYRQPVTKPEVDQIRGVNSNEVVNSLVEKNLVEPVGQKETIGKPWMFGTTTDFLKAFGLNSIEELPKLRELDEVVQMLNAENPDEEIVIDATGEKEESKSAEIEEAKDNENLPPTVESNVEADKQQNNADDEFEELLVEVDKSTDDVQVEAETLKDNTQVGTVLAEDSAEAEEQDGQEL